MARAISRLGVEGWWRTGEIAAGDAVAFSVHTVHASMGNRSDRVRLSTGWRYQPAGTVRDERWVGEQPVGHGQAGKRGRVC